MTTHIKYPRTEHLPGSKITPDMCYQELSICAPHNTSFVIEEKMDGIGLGIFFIDERIHIQQRGHLFDLDELPYFLHNFKFWLLAHEELLYFIVGNRYVLFGEWMEFKHTVFYNNLPSYFLEYDIFDRHNNMFLNTKARHDLIGEQLTSVKVMDITTDLKVLATLLKNNQSYANNTQWEQDYQSLLKKHPQVKKNTLQNASYEGFYIKLEDEQQVLSRYKWIRKDFFDIVAKNEPWTIQVKI